MDSKKIKLQSANIRIQQIVKLRMDMTGMTPEQLSEKTGLGKSTIRNFLDGRRNLTIASAESILSAFELELGVRKITRE